MVAYLVINNGDIIFASHDVNKANILCERKNHAGMLEEIDDIDEVLEDLTEEDIARMAFSNGLNGGHHYVAKVAYKDGGDGSVETDEGDEYTFEEIESALAEHSDLDNHFYDTFDDESCFYDDDDEDDFDDEDEEYED